MGLGHMVRYRNTRTLNQIKDIPRVQINPSPRSEEQNGTYRSEKEGSEF